METIMRLWQASLASYTLAIGLGEALSIPGASDLANLDNSEAGSRATEHPPPTKQMQAQIDKDISRAIGSCPRDPGPLATNLSSDVTLAAISAVIRKVSDWQLNESKAYFGNRWWWGVLYSGLISASRTTQDSKYRAAAQAAATQAQWQIDKRNHSFPSADDLSMAISYLELYLDTDRASDEWISSARQAMDLVFSKATAPDRDVIPWWYADALHGGPPAWSRMYNATGDEKYLEYVHSNWQLTYDRLYDKSHHLWYRDESYIQTRAANGASLFWSRAEGWVIAGLARMLPYLPIKDPKRPYYEQQLREMAATMAQLQDPVTGLWHSSMLDTDHFPDPEISGSALMTLGIAWGINNGVLPATYKTTVLRAWRGLLRHVYEDGRLGGIQQTGTEPAYFPPQASFVYGVGAFLMLGEEMTKLQ